MFNTGINGRNTGYTFTSPKYTAPLYPAAATEQDDHWLRAQSTIGTGAGVASEPVLASDVVYDPATPTSNKVTAYGRVDVLRGHRIWVQSPFGNAEWIAKGNGGTMVYHVFRYQFYMDPSVTPGSFNLNLDFFSDDYVRRIFVNGTEARSFINTASETSTTTGMSGGGGINPSSRTNAILNKGWNYYDPNAADPATSNLNTIYVVINNQNTPVGLLVQANGAAACAPDMIVTKKALKSLDVDVTASSPTPGTPAQPFDTAAVGGNTVYYDITISNLSLNSGDGTKLTDTLPAAFDVSGAAGTRQWQCLVPRGSKATCPTPTTGNFTAANRTLSVQIGGGTPATGTLPSGSSLLYRITGRLNADLSQTPVITNTATIQPPSSLSCAAKDGYPTPCTASETISTGPVVSLTKTVSPVGATLYPGDKATFTITASNEGSVALPSMKIQDTLPAEFETADWTCVSPTGSQAFCPAASGTLTAGALATLGDTATNPTAAQRPVPVNSSLVYTVVAKVKTITTLTGSTVTNTAALTPVVASPATGWQCKKTDGTFTTSGTTACSASADVPIAPKLLELTKTIDTSKTYYPGDAAVYTITATNKGTGALTNVKVTDILPAGLLDAGWSCTGCAATTTTGNAPLNYTIATLAAGASAVFTVNTTVADPVALVSPAQTLAITNDASAQTMDSTGNIVDSSTQCVASGAITHAVPCTDKKTITATMKPQLGVTKSALTGPYFSGQDVTYSVAINNPGLVNTNQVQLADALPGEFVSGAWTCSVTVPTGATTPTAAQNYCTAFGTVNATALDTSTLSTPSPTSLTLLPGETVTFKAIAKLGNINTLTGTATVNNTAKATSAAAAPWVCVVGTPVAPVPPSTLATCEATAPITVSNTPQLGVTKTVPSAGPYFSNAEVTYSIEVANPGLVPIADVVMTDNLPGDFVSVAWTCKSSLTLTPPTAAQTFCDSFTSAATTLDTTSTPIALNAGEVVTFKAVAKLGVLSGTKTDVPNTAVVKSTSPIAWSCTTLNTATPPACASTALVNLSGVPELAITNVVNKGTAAPGDEVTFTITAFNNTGLNITDGLLVSDATDQPTFITLTSWSCTGSTGGASCPSTGGSGSGSLSQSGLVMPMGSTLVYTVKGTIAPTVVTDNAAIVLTGSFSTAVAGANCTRATPCTAPQTVTVKLKPPVLKLTHSASPDTVKPGGTSTFTIIAKNESGKPITDGALTVDVPANLSLGAWSCVAASGGAVCPQSLRLTKVGVAQVRTTLSLPVDGSLTFEAIGTLANTLKDGESVTMDAILNTATPDATCTTGALPCVQPAKVTVKVAAVAATPVPVDAAWMLAALSSLLLAGAAIAQRRARHANARGAQPPVS